MSNRMSALEIRPMRYRDMARFSPRYLPDDFVGLVGETDGDLVGAVCILVLDRPILCFEITPALRNRRFLLHRMAKMMVRAGLSAFDQLWTQQDLSEPTSERWLRRLGFSPSDEYRNGERLWQQSRQQSPASALQ